MRLIAFEFHFARALCLACGLVFGWASVSAADQITLRAGVFVPLQTTYGVPFQQFVDIVNADGDGPVQIQVLGGPEAMPGHELAGAVRSGVLDMAAVPPSYYKNLMVEGDTQILSNMTLDEQRESGAFALLNQLANQKLNAEHVTSYGLGVRFHIYVREEIDEPSDLRGLRFRSQPNYTAFLQALGIDPTNIPAPEVYTALERGVVDGYVWPLWGITDFSWEEYTAVRVHPGFYNVVVNILINQDRWEGLSEEQRAYLREKTAEFEQQYQAWAERKTEEVREKQTAAGIRQIDFSADFADLAYQSYWEQLISASPEHGPRLRELLTK